MKAFGVRWHTIIASPSIMVSAASAVHLGAVTGLVVLMIQLYPDRLDFFVPLAFAVFPAGLLWHAARERLNVHVGILQFIEVGTIVSICSLFAGLRMLLFMPG